MMILAAVAPTPALFALFRFLAGVGFGGIPPTAIAQVYEFAPRDPKGRADCRHAEWFRHRRHSCRRVVDPLIGTCWLPAYVRLRSASLDHTGAAGRMVAAWRTQPLRRASIANHRRPGSVPGVVCCKGVRWFSTILFAGGEFLRAAAFFCAEHVAAAADARSRLPHRVSFAIIASARHWRSRWSFAGRVDRRSNRWPQGRHRHVYYRGCIAGLPFPSHALDALQGTHFHHRRRCGRQSIRPFWIHGCPLSHRLLVRQPLAPPPEWAAWVRQRVPLLGGLLLKAGAHLSGNVLVFAAVSVLAGLSIFFIPRTLHECAV